MSGFMLDAPASALGITGSVCNVCRKTVPAKIFSRGGDVYMKKFCAEHGESEAFIRAGVEEYLSTLRYVKPALTPAAFAGNGTASCPDGCGFCDRHEQHLCMPIIEVTTRCDLECPACINASGGRAGVDMTPAEFSGILDDLLVAERQVDLLNISGGEPLVHPGILGIIDDALSREGIVRVSISTNGLRLLEDAVLLGELKARDVVISLQFDGFDDEAYKILRGRRLLQEKLAVLDALIEFNISTSLTFTAARGINEGQLPRVVEYLFSTPNVVSLMVQPLAFTGRGVSLSGRAGRLTIPDVVRLIGDSGHPGVSAADFVPLPCSHPLCFSLAFYLMTDNGAPVSLNKLAGISGMLDTLSNKVVFGLNSTEQERLREMVYEIWSGPVAAAPEGKAVLSTLSSILRELSASTSCCFDSRKIFSLMERRIKSIFIHAFQDPESFDLARARRCCQAYPLPDGRLMPACVRNVIHQRNGRGE